MDPRFLGLWVAKKRQNRLKAEIVTTAAATHTACTDPAASGAHAGAPPSMPIARFMVRMAGCSWQLDVHGYS